MTLYEAACKTLPAADIDHHESDLYLRKTPAAVAMVESWITKTGFKSCVSTFRCQIEGDLWFEVVAAYDPYWIERTGRSAKGGAANG